MKDPALPGSLTSSYGKVPSTAQSEHLLRDGTPVSVRPIQATDVELEREFIERLSPRSRRYRFLGSISTPSADLLRQLTQPQLTHGAAFVALLHEGDAMREIGVSRYSTGTDAGSCECAVVVSDEWQGKGLATLLMQRLTEAARRNGFKRMYSIDAADNHEMRDLAGHLGFKSLVDPGDPTLVIHTLEL